MIQHKSKAKEGAKIQGLQLTLEEPELKGCTHTHTPSNAEGLGRKERTNNSVKEFSVLAGFVLSSASMISTQ